MTKTEFKVGDRVMLTQDKGNAAKLGAEAVVVEPNWLPPGSGRYLKIKWDRSKPHVNGQMDGGYMPNDFKLVKSAPKDKKPSQAYKGNGNHSWDVVVPKMTDRLRVPGGYIYRDIQSCAAVFVPMPDVVKHKV